MKRATILLALSLTASAQPSFEVASVKEIKRTDGRVVHSIQSKPLNLALRISGNGFRLPQATLSGLIMDAYSVREDQFTGLPDWAADTLQYEIAAKAAEPLNAEQVRMMLQSLLADRFKLKLRHETKNLTVYELSIAPSGVRVGLVLERKDDARTPWAIVPSLIEGFLDYPLVDKTGLKGFIPDKAQTWDQTKLMEEIKDARPAGLPPGVAYHGLAPSIFHDVETQLGLTLKKVTAPGDFLVIEHLERPSEN